MALAAWGTNSDIVWVARTGTTNVMIWEGGVNHPVVLPGMNRITDHPGLHLAGAGIWAVPAKAVPALPAVVLPVCLKMKYAV